MYKNVWLLHCRQHDKLLKTKITQPCFQLKAERCSVKLLLEMAFETEFTLGNITLLGSWLVSTV